jgi:ATP-dependent RNA helicase HelY
VASPAERYAAARERARARLLSRFEAELPFPLDPFQRQSCEALESGSSVLVAAPTGAGKTVVGEFAIYLALEAGRKCFYTTPIKALSNQKYQELVARYGTDRVGLLTGDNSINGEAPVVIMTTEVLRNMLYAESSTLDNLGYVVMDEVHYLADRFRGAVWEEVIIHLQQSVTLVALSATVSNAEEFGAWLETVRGHTTIVVDEYRPVPLWQHVMVGERIHDLFTSDGKVNPDLVRLRREDQPTRHRRGRPRGGPRTPWRSEIVDELNSRGLLPAIYFLFSRAGCDEAVEQCIRAGIRLTTPEEREEIRRVVVGDTLGIPDEDLAALGFTEWADGMERGLASHHAGLLPILKEITERLFQRGLVKVVFATETLALGINMPAKTVVLERLVKWNGETHVDITPGEYTQLTGRAGRRGIDVEGHAVVVWQRDLDPENLAGLASTRTYPLRSSFVPSYNMAVNLVTRMGRARAREVLETSFAQFQADQAVVGLAAEIRRWEAAQEGYRPQMTCHLGDFVEYAGIRERLTRLEKEGSRKRALERRDAIEDSLRGLSVGDVILIATGKRAGPAVVVGTPRRDDLRPLVVTGDRQVRKLSVADTGRPVQVVGRIKVPRGFSTRDMGMRKDLASRAIEAARNADVEHPQHHASDDGSGALREQLRAHPCHGCTDRESHARWAERFYAAQRSIDNLNTRIARRTKSVGRRFDRICDLLVALGYLEGTGDSVAATSQGALLAKIYTEADLLVAEALRRGVLEDLSPEELAAVVSTFLFESRRSDDQDQPSVPRGAIEAAIDQLDTIDTDIREIEREYGIPSGREMDRGLVWAVYRWAQGATLLTILTRNDVTAGDFVRWTRQVIDLLGQITTVADDSLADRSRRAIALLDRGVVSYSSTV